MASAVVLTPTGTSSLTECGLIPAVLNAVGMDSDEFVAKLIGEDSLTAEEGTRIRSMLRFIAAQAVQILEGAIVTHSNALSAFHNLKGVEILTTRLSKEVVALQNGRVQRDKDQRDDPMDVEDSPEKMEVDDELGPPVTSGPHSSQRVLLFGVLTCLTVVFHQESTSSSVTTPAGSAQLRKPELTGAVMEIMDKEGGDLDEVAERVRQRTLQVREMIHEEYRKAQEEQGDDAIIEGEIVDGNGSSRS